MKNVTWLLIPFALLSACRTAQPDIAPGNSSSAIQTPLDPQTGQTKATTLSPVAQITNYYADLNGDKTVILNGEELKLTWTLKNIYAYDALNRLAQQTTTAHNNNWWESFAYQYTPDLAQHYQNSDNKDYRDVLLLNEQGYLKGNQGPGEYVYDTQGYLIRYQGNGQRDTYTIQDGDVVAKETIYSSGSVQRNTYEYDRTRPGIPYPLTFRGRQSQHLLIKQTLVTTGINPSGSQTTVFIYSYDVDPQARPIREFVMADTESTPRSVREFIYQ